MAAHFAPALQSLLVLSLPVLLAVAPMQGPVRTVVLGDARQADIVNAAIGVEGRILSRRGNGLVLAGRRDRLALALLPLGVLVLPVEADGCSDVGRG